MNVKRVTASMVVRGDKNLIYIHWFDEYSALSNDGELGER
jgi:DNA-binding IclR family transcriptional regulator